MSMPIEQATCDSCGVTGQIVIDWRPELQARPLGTFSLSGHQTKASARWVDWPWAVCTNCGRESRGQVTK